MSNWNQMPTEAGDVQHEHHLFTLKIRARDILEKQLAAARAQYKAIQKDDHEAAEKLKFERKYYTKEK